MTRRLGSATLVAEAMCIVFGGMVAWQLMTAGGDADRGRTALWLGAALAALGVLAAGLLRTRAGVLLGWLVQLALLASAIVFRPMLVVALVFGGLWWLSLHHGRRIDADRARWAAADAHPSALTTPTTNPSSSQES